MYQSCLCGAVRLQSVFTESFLPFTRLNFFARFCRHFKNGTERNWTNKREKVIHAVTYMSSQQEDDELLCFLLFVRGKLSSNPRMYNGGGWRFLFSNYYLRERLLISKRRFQQQRYNSLYYPDFVGSVRYLFIKESFSKYCNKTNPSTHVGGTTFACTSVV